MDGFTLAQEVLTELAEDGIERSEDPGEAETVVRERMLALGAQTLQLHLEKRKVGYAGASRPGACGERQRFVEYRPKTITTLLGDVTLRRAYYRCGSCKTTSVPYDERIGLGTGQVSPGLAKAAAVVGIQEPGQSHLDWPRLRGAAGNRVRQLWSRRCRRRTPPFSACRTPFQI